MNAELYSWGAAGEVTGSKHFLTVDGRTLMVDCGAFQGRRESSDRKNREWPFDHTTIDAVVLTTGCDKTTPSAIMAASTVDIPAIVLSGGKDHSAAVDAEHRFISKIFGEQDKDWKVAEQSMVSDSGKTYDMVQVEMIKTGEKHFYYFDITWYAKKAKRPQNTDQ